MCRSASPSKELKEKLALATTQPIGSGRLVIFFSNQSPLLVAPSSLSPFETAHNILLPLASGHPSPTLVILHLPVESLITPAKPDWAQRVEQKLKICIQFHDTILSYLFAIIATSTLFQNHAFYNLHSSEFIFHKLGYI